MSDELREQIREGLPRFCCARRHMRAAEFMTYNAMYACAFPHKELNGGKLIFTAGDYWLANANNRSVNQEREARGKLEAESWAVLVAKKVGRSNHYEIIEHDAYVQAHPNSCPPMRYVDQLMADVTGKDKYDPARRQAGDEPSNFALARAIRAEAARLGWPAMVEYLRGLSPEIREQIVKHWKGEDEG